MGILNLTPDSFSDGGRFKGAAAVDRALALVADGADILDLGGESTRPGAAEVPADEEIARTAPVIRALRDAGVAVPISIDTRNARVAQAALAAGASLVNDVSALTHDPDLGRVVADWGVPIILMHARGTPQTMQIAPAYADVVAEVRLHLAQRIAAAEAAGIARARIIIDPGLGFGKTVAHNLALLRGLAALHGLGAPVLVGASRKSFIGALTGVAQPDQRLAGSLAVALHAARAGAAILRVHDVAETKQALSLWQALEQGDQR